MVFQPHRYSRTQLLESEFAACFGDCDELQVLDIYSAGESPIEGIDAERLAAGIQAAASQTSVTYAPSMEQACRAAAESALPGDAIITLGAGSVWQAGEKILARLASPERQATAQL